MLTPKIVKDVSLDDIDGALDVSGFYNTIRDTLLKQQEQYIITWLGAKDSDDAFRMLKSLNDYGLTVIMEQEPVHFVMDDFDDDSYKCHAEQKVLLKLVTLEETRNVG